jgi:SsrA-binding protein
MKAITNKEAYFSFEILDKLEVGIVLQGHEVKSVKAGQISLKGSYVSIRKNPKPELFLINANISKYQKAGPLPNHDPQRERKLLINKSELNKLIGKLEQTGLTIVPLKVYTKRNLVKLEIGLAKGKKLYQKKQEKKKQDVEKEIRRAVKYQN